MEFIAKFIELVKNNLPISEITKNPLLIVDILIVILIIYWLYELLKNSKAVRIFYGLLVLGVMLYISALLHLYLLNLVLGIFLTVVIVAIPVVFQPELRNLLEKIGRTGFNKNIFKDESLMTFIGTIKESINIMANNKIGGIIAIQRKTGLSDFTKSGKKINALISKELIVSIFSKNSLLHDGAILIIDKKIKAASVILPLSESDAILTLGTRHRAALGLSEQSDAVVIVVSEKTGKISLAVDGKMELDISPEDLEKKIKKFFKPEKITRVILP